MIMKFKALPTAYTNAFRIKIMSCYKHQRFAFIFFFFFKLQMGNKFRAQTIDSMHFII